MSRYPPTGTRERSHWSKHPYWYLATRGSCTSIYGNWNSNRNPCLVTRCGDTPSLARIFFYGSCKTLLDWEFRPFFRFAIRTCAVRSQRARTTTFRDPCTRHPVSIRSGSARKRYAYLHAHEYRHTQYSEYSASGRLYRIGARREPGFAPRCTCLYTTLKNLRDFSVISAIWNIQKAET